MQLKQTGTQWDRDTRNDINDNWDTIANNFNGAVQKTIDEAKGQVIDELVDNAKLTWVPAVENYVDIGTTYPNPEEGWTVNVSSEGNVYRYDGTDWVQIQSIDPGPYNELSSRLADTEDKNFFGSTISHKNPKPIIVWIDDDGKKEFYTKLRPLAQEYGIKFNSCVITSYDNGWDGGQVNPDYMSVSEMLQMQSEGTGEFVFHTHVHSQDDKLIDMTESELRSNYEIGIETMKRNGLQGYRHIVYPFGEINGPMKSITREYFESGFVIRNQVATRPFDQYEIPRVSFDTQTAERIKGDIDSILENNEMLVIMSHVGASTIEFDEAKAREIIEYAASKDVEFKGVEEALRTNGNILQIGRDTISADGVINGGSPYAESIGTLEMVPYYAYTPNAPITDYPENRATIQNVINDDRAQFNLPVSGTVLTVRHGTQTQGGYQKFTPFYKTYRDTFFELIRGWDDDAQEWGDWQQTGQVELMKRTSYEPNAPATAFPPDRITHLKIRNTEYEAYGLPAAGRIEVFSDYDPSFTDQVYYRRLGTDVLRRYWIASSNSWSDWVSIN